MPSRRHCESQTGKRWNNTSTKLGCCLAEILGVISGKYSSANVHNDSTAETNEKMQTPQLKQRNDVKSQTSSLKETSLQNLQPLRNSSQKMKLLREPALCLNNSRNC